MASILDKVKQFYTLARRSPLTIPVILFLGVLLGVELCLSAGIMQISTQESISQQVQTKIAKFIDHAGQQHELKLEVATTAAAQAQGLMYRTELASDKGMLFVFDSVAPRTFWMENTYIPLDILFVDENMHIVKIHSKTKPNQIQEVYPSGVPIKYGVETNGGWAEFAGIQTGDQIILE